MDHRRIGMIAVAAALIVGPALAQERPHGGGAPGGGHMAATGGGFRGGGFHGGGMGAARSAAPRAAGGAHVPVFRAGGFHGGGRSAGAHAARAASGIHAGGAATHTTHTTHTGIARAGAAHLGAVHAAARAGTHAAVAGGAAGIAAAASHVAGRAQPHYDPASYPHAVDPPSRYHWRGAWTGQSGYYPRHWVFGDYLPFAWFAEPFWIVDWAFYGLPIAPLDYVWVRVGPDALLVNIYTGEVVEVEYGLFW